MAERIGETVMEAARKTMSAVNLSLRCLGGSFDD